MADGGGIFSAAGKLTRAGIPIAENGFGSR
jgi:hypothetical protein